MKMPLFLNEKYYQNGVFLLAYGERHKGKGME